MREQDFWASTLRSLINRIEGYNKHYQLQQHEAWEQSRMIAFFCVSPHTKKGKLRKFSDLIKFPWENLPKAHDELKAGREKAMAWFEEYRQKQEAEADG